MRRDDLKRLIRALMVRRHNDAVRIKLLKLKDANAITEPVKKAIFATAMYKAQNPMQEKAKKIYH